MKHYTTVTEIEDQLRYLNYDHSVMDKFDVRDIFESYKSDEILVSTYWNTISAYEIEKFKKLGFKFSHCSYGYTRDYQISACFSYKGTLI